MKRMRPLALLLMLALSALVGLPGLRAAADVCTTTAIDERCETWYAFEDSIWQPQGYGIDSAQAMAVTVKGPVVTGLSEKPGDNASGSAYDYFTAAFDATGNTLWTHRYHGGNGPDMARAIASDPLGSAVYVTGESSHVGTSTGVATVAYHAEGGRRWVARFDGPGGDFGQAVTVSPDGSTVYVGAAVGGAPDTKLLVFAYEALTGAPIWTGTYQGSKTSAVEDLAASPDGARVFMSGWTGQTGGYVTAAFEARDEDHLGDLLWASVHEPGAQPDRAAAVGVSPDSRTVYTTGTTLTNGARATTIAYDAETGARRWISAVGPSNGSGWGIDLLVDPDGSAVHILGEQAAPFADGSVFSLDPTTGQERWKTVYGLEGYVERGRGMVLGPGNEMYVVFESAAPGAADTATLAIDRSTGAILWRARANASTREISGPTGPGALSPYGVGILGDRLFVGGLLLRPIDGHASTVNRDLGAIAYDI